ncbi:RagB/SusD family nutrient uptake outer membrane protein [Tamlana agarivorans]|uniref:RagB/SusD family nutrient uptake outer membrane protein n=1 Tax=Pseudotamlana agarivorans TaxID=481183 RepID=A0ACC5UC55_9FLAO|nr:RagB/SusD family nutrient uptake outer membrane protein [Tamlana agarivorans]MBU2951902.1 RagB/SusD family nutrient uptake outer membrane protein [Tamlana agarivorans]
MKNIINRIIPILTISFFMVSCHGDLDQFPIDPDSFTEQDVFANATEAKGALAKLYASLALTGQDGGDGGNADITDIEQGFSQYTRMLFNLNELTTDHGVVGWGDSGLPDLHGMYWTGSNSFTGAMYLRLAQQVSFCNSFITNAEGLSDAEAQTFIAEARFLRAFAYYNLIDFYGSVPLVTKITTDLPSQASRTELFNFVETELLEVKDLLPDAKGNEYGRVDKVAAWALLSKLYLNADVWTGTDRYSDCVAYSNDVINSSYAINTVDANGNGTAYDELFLADNNSNGAQNEFIFLVNFDGKQSTTYGGSTFLIHAAIGGTMDPTEFGVNGGWGGNRVTKNLVNKFETGDQRGMFYTDGQNLEIESIPQFSEGYACTKFKNIDSNGEQGNDKTGEFTDVDLALIRLPEIFLNYAEASLRGGGGDMNTAVTLINQLRERAYGDASGNISAADLDLQFVLDERSRELYWEGQRRTDLVRYNFFTTANYLWPFKANQKNGTSTDPFRNIFPIPNNTISTNPNLIQNPGY